MPGSQSSLISASLFARCGKCLLFFSLSSDSFTKQQVVKTVSVEKKFVGFRAISAVSQSGYLPTFLPAMRVPVGTPLHVAPELALQLPFNEKADMYSFGLLIWESAAPLCSFRLCIF